MADFKGRKRGKSHVQNVGIFFGDSGHGTEPSCQISAYYKFFQGKNYFYRTICCYIAIVHFFFQQRNGFLFGSGSVQSQGSILNTLLKFKAKSSTELTQDNQ